MQRKAEPAVPETAGGVAPTTNPIEDAAGLTAVLRQVVPSMEDHGFGIVLDGKGFGVTRGARSALVRGTFVYTGNLQHGEIFLIGRWIRSDKPTGCWVTGTASCQGPVCRHNICQRVRLPGKKQFRGVFSARCILGSSSSHRPAACQNDSDLSRIRYLHSDQVV